MINLSVQLNWNKKKTFLELRIVTKKNWIMFLKKLWTKI